MTQASKLQQIAELVGSLDANQNAYFAADVGGTFGFTK